MIQDIHGISIDKTIIASAENTRKDYTHFPAEKISRISFSVTRKTDKEGTGVLSSLDGFRSRLLENKHL